MADHSSATMIVAHFTEPGGPEVLRACEWPTPTPGPGDVLVKVAFAGLIQADTMQRRGLYPPPPGT